MSSERITAKQFQQASDVEDWRALAFGASAWFDAPSHAAGAALVRRVVQLTESTDRLPDMDLRAGGVHLRVGSDGLSTADVELAREISAVAQDLGLAADPTAAQTMQLTFDALDKSAVLPFWRTAFGYELHGDDDLVDPMRRQPAVWFQQQDEPRPLRNRIHIDVSGPHTAALQGAEAIAAAGGHYTGQNDYTLADAEGNEADVIADSDLGEETTDWRVMFGALAFYPVGPERAAELTDAVATLSDVAGLPMLVDLRRDGVTIDTGKDGWEDERFPDLAQRIQAAAHDLALTADPTSLRFMQMGIDAVDIPLVREFWRAVLGYEYDPRPFVTDIYDPRRLNPPLFFQQMDASDADRRKQRNRIHVDVFVPDDQAQTRIDIAVAAGGRVVYDDGAPAWWTLADQEGNEIDLAVSVGREELWQE